MSLLGYWNDLISQQPFGTDDSENARASSTRAQLNQINSDEAVIYGQDWYAQTQINAAADLQSEADLGTVSDAFASGAEDGWGNVLGFTSGTIKNAFKRIGQILSATIFAIPLWAWLLAALVLFFYLGGGTLLKRKLKLS